MKVMAIERQSTHEFIEKIHYTHTLPPIMFAFGLFKETEILGITTWGNSPNCFEVDRWKPFPMFELNRVVIITKEKNAGSFLIGKSIKLMPKPSVLISYADTNVGHKGYLYQATNWLYTGLSTEKYLCTKENGEIIRSRSDEGNSVIIHRERLKGKHRYFYLNGNKKDKKTMLEMLKKRYFIEPYPKGETARICENVKIETQEVLF